MREQNGLQNFPEKGKACEAPFSLIPRSIQNQPIITFQLSCTQLIHENEYMEGGKKTLLFLKLSFTAACTGDF